MDNPRICAVIVNDDLQAVKAIAPLADLFEVRIDLIGDGWRKLVKHLGKPWIACNRIAEEGGGWQGSEANRIKELLSAVELGAEIVDIELESEKSEETINLVKGKAKSLVSYHNLERTPPLGKLRAIMQRQLKSGADICKVVTTARKFGDNLSVLQLIKDFPKTRVVSFAMGDSGIASRILCPLIGGYFTYAAIEEGRESATGQLTVENLSKIYGMLKDGK